MKQVYQKMELEHKIGPVGPDGNLKPFAEYPKKVRRADGRKITCKDQTEEVAVKMWAGDSPKADPVAAERDALATKLAEAMDKIARYERGVPEAAVLPGGVPKGKAADEAQGMAGPATAANGGGTDKAPAPSAQAPAGQAPGAVPAAPPPDPLVALKK
jgi:hypothetical protein